MAGGDGYVLIDRIREISSIPVLVVTGTNPAYARRRIEGFDRVCILSKPFEKNQLLSTLANLLVSDGQRRLQLHESVG